MVLLKWKTRSFLCLPVTRNLRNTWLASEAFPPLPLDVGQYFSMVPSMSSPGLYSFTLSPVICLISFTYTTRGTKHKTQTHHVQLLTNGVETHKSTRKTPHRGGRRGRHLSRREKAPLPSSSRRDGSGESRPATDCDSAFLAPTSSAPVFLEVNQTHLKIIIIQATKMMKTCHKIWNIWISHLLSPANDGSCCFLLVYAKSWKKMCRICINDIPVFSSFV